MVGRVDQGGDFPGAAAVALRGEGHCRPDRGVGVLAAVFAHAGHVALDISGVQVGLVERRVEQLDQARFAPNQACVQRLHGTARMIGIRDAGQHRPTLRDRVDLAFAVARRAQRGAVVEPGAAIPAAVPGVLFDVFAQTVAFRCAEFGEIGVVVLPRQRAELAQHLDQEEAQPDALALAVDADPIHAVVPVAGADQRQAVFTKAHAVPDGAHAMLIQAFRAFGLAGQVVVGLVVRVERVACQIGNMFLQHAGVAAAQHIAAGGQRQPQVIVGTMGAHAAPGGRVPPVLHIAFAELSAGAQQ